MKAALSVVRLSSAVRGRIRVLVVDDSVVMRHLLQQALRQDPGIEVIGTAENGAAALAQIPDLQPDVVTLDIEMPEMDGIETLRQIRKKHPKLRTIMFSTLTTKGGAATFEALSLGADDYVEKASNAGSLDKSLASLRSQLIPKIKQFFISPDEPLKLSPVMSATTRRTPAATPTVLAIGVSTGGPQALAALIPKIPASFPLPILIVQHMPPTFTRLLAERLQAVSSLKVYEAEDGMPVTPGSIFVARGNYHLKVVKSGSSNVTALDQGPHENSCRPSVDVLFRSLAEHYGDGVLYVVLTGMGNDGLLGAQRLKAAGAYGIAQDEASSVVWGMPGAIVKAGLADRILPLDQIPPELIGEPRGKRMDITKIAPAAVLSAENYDFLERFIHQLTGIALGPDKHYLLESRLTPLLRDEKVSSLSELCVQLRRSPSDTLRRRIAESMTTHETSFFRDPAVFEVLRSKLLPELANERQSTKKLRIWSAACSSGQEAYSTAMVLLEAGFANWNIEILGTDLSLRILERARAGRFLQLEVNRGLPAPLLVKYFERVGLDWQVKEEIRRMVRFAPFDLRQNMGGLGPFDLVFCRNVLIYFDISTRKQILSGISSALNPGGSILLGASETTFNLGTDFKRTMIGNTVVYQNATAGVKR